MSECLEALRSAVKVSKLFEKVLMEDAKTLYGNPGQGRFHEIAQPAPEALLAGVAPPGEIHLENQCASECPVDGVRLRGGQKFVPPQKTLLLESR